jgi:hypothetical protein
MKTIERVWIIPGGGVPSDDGLHMPQWTEERTDAAIEAWKRLDDDEQRARVSFVALSLGTMNRPTVKDPVTGHMSIESSLISRRLITHGGVPMENIVADAFSWDTVSNAWVSRQVVEGLLSRYSEATVDLRIFISDFHAARVQAAFEWLFSLEPRLERVKGIRIESVPHSAKAEDEAAWAARREHEARGVRQTRENSANIRTLAQFHAWLFLGGHRGFWEFSHGTRVIEERKALGW